MSKLVILRHGESTWNLENRFTGWVDVDLTPNGQHEAERAGILLHEAPDISLDFVHTSLLTRAVRTANIALAAAGIPYLPVQRHWRLNERHYGALQGLNKAETALKYGDAQVLAWRRGFLTPPPPVDISDPNHPIHDPRYAGIPIRALPPTECLADVIARLLPYFQDVIAPQLLQEQSVLVVAHGNSLRALMKYLEEIDDEGILSVEIPTGVPRVYDLDDALRVKDVHYLT